MVLRLHSQQNATSPFNSIASSSQMGYSTRDPSPLHLQSKSNVANANPRTASNIPPRVALISRWPSSCLQDTRRSVRALPKTLLMSTRTRGRQRAIVSNPRLLRLIHTTRLIPRTFARRICRVRGLLSVSSLKIRPGVRMPSTVSEVWAGIMGRQLTTLSYRMAIHLWAQEIDAGRIRSDAIHGPMSHRRFLQVSHFHIVAFVIYPFALCHVPARHCWQAIFRHFSPTRRIELCESRWLAIWRRGVAGVVGGLVALVWCWVEH